MDIPALIEASKYVQSKCLNDCYAHEVFGNVWCHALPLKDKEKHFLSPSNWDLPESEIAKIQDITKKLNDYATVVFDLVYSQKGKPLKDSLKKITDMLPPWMVFPLYDAYCMGWRMGNGEEYQDVYIGFIRSLTEEEFEVYNKAYPQPEYMGTRFAFFLNLLNHELRKEG